MENTTPPPRYVETAEDKTVAIVSYLTLIGFIIAAVLHTNKKTQLGAFHLRQMLGLMISSVALWILAASLSMIPFVGGVTLMLMPLVWLALFVFWVLGLAAAVNGQMKPLPWIGELYQKWFEGAFA